MPCGGGGRDNRPRCPGRFGQTSKVGVHMLHRLPNNPAHEALTLFHIVQRRVRPRYQQLLGCYDSHRQTWTRGHPGGPAPDGHCLRRFAERKKRGDPQDRRPGRVSAHGPGREPAGDPVSGLAAGGYPCLEARASVNCCGTTGCKSGPQWDGVESCPLCRCHWPAIRTGTARRRPFVSGLPGRLAAYADAELPVP